jgi:ATP-dependent Clp protease ATP-binding subunit ClpA
VSNRRFIPKPGDIDPNEGFARFTPRARNVVADAHNQAQAAGSAEITPAHLVLGLLGEPRAFAALAMVDLGASFDAVRSAASNALPPPSDDVPDVIPYDVEARKTLELTFREALRLGHNYIGTEHILLALLDQEAGAGVLSGLGLEKPAVEAKLVEMLTAAAG